MKKLLLVLFLSAPAICAAAQIPYSVTKTRPAHPGGPISMRDAILGPENPAWPESGEPDCVLSERDGSLYLHDTILFLKAGAGVTFGTSVSRNEFGIDGGIFPGPAGKVAFYRKDESRVREFPLLDIDSAAVRMIRYPMNGEESEILSLGIYDPHTGRTAWTLKTHEYLTNVCWSPGGRLFAQTVDRAQHNSELVEINPADGSVVKTVLTEHNDAWVEPQDPLRFFPQTDRVFVYSTDNRTGWRNFFLCDHSGNLRRIVERNEDQRFVCIDGEYLYYTAATPLQNHLYRVRVANLKSVQAARIGKPERITRENGWHEIRLCNEGIADRFASLDGRCFQQIIKPGVSVGYGSRTDLTPNREFEAPVCELGTLPTADGSDLNHYRLTYPVGYQSGQKYPLVVYVYGGPHSQMVKDTYMGPTRNWDILLAQKGFLVYVQDNRGTQNRGARYEKAINRMCGKAEAEDQLLGVQMLIERGLVDTSRIAVHGWSYGGYMALTLATERPDLFKVAVAGGPVIDWKWYEVMYGERYMDNPRTNPDGFLSTSLIPKAGNLKAKTLIIQGAVDNTVVPQHSLSFIQECIGSGVPVEYFTFPRAEHNMRGSERVYLYDRITEFICRNLR